MAEAGFHQVVYAYTLDRKKKHELITKRAFFGIVYVDPSNEEMYEIFRSTHKYSTIPWLTVSNKPADWTVMDRFIDEADQWNILSSDVFTGMK